MMLASNFRPIYPKIAEMMSWDRSLLQQMSSSNNTTFAPIATDLLYANGNIKPEGWTENSRMFQAFTKYAKFGAFPKYIDPDQEASALEHISYANDWFTVGHWRLCEMHFKKAIAFCASSENVLAVTVAGANLATNYLAALDWTSALRVCDELIPLVHARLDMTLSRLLTIRRLCCCVFGYWERVDNDTLLVRKIAPVLKELGNTALDASVPDKLVYARIQDVYAFVGNSENLQILTHYWNTVSERIQKTPIEGSEKDFVLPTQERNPLLSTARVENVRMTAPYNASYSQHALVGLVTIPIGIVVGLGLTTLGRIGLLSIALTLVVAPVVGIGIAELIRRVFFKGMRGQYFGLAASVGLVIGSAWFVVLPQLSGVLTGDVGSIWALIPLVGLAITLAVMVTRMRSFQKI